MHLDEIQKQFYLEESNVEDKLEFISVYKSTLLDLLRVTAVVHVSSISGKEPKGPISNFSLLRSCLNALNELHVKWLSILPRPSEPVELGRFKRVIYDQIILLKKTSAKQTISISINEEVGEAISLDPLHEFKTTTLRKLLTDYNSKYPANKINIADEKLPDVLKLHITIPRVDAGNTFRWPSLIHEMAHSLMGEISFNNNPIDSDFLTFCNHEQFILNYFQIQTIKSTTKLKHWLTECWCDLMACILIGPSFYLSQYLVFLNAPKQDLENYPPVSFRLYLIESILSGRFPRRIYSMLENDFIGPCEELINALEEPHYTEAERLDLARLSNYFKTYFKNHFFASGNGISLKGNETINVNLQSIVTKYVSVDADIVDYLRQRLNDGLPIPSIPILTPNGSYDETPSFVQEIFLASWMSRTEILKPQLLKSLETFSVKKDFVAFYEEMIQKPISRHDQAVLKSIQVSEWFDLFNKGKIRPSRIVGFNFGPKDDAFSSPGILVDKEIRALIFNNELKIIPIMNLSEQVGTTSIDIRLGTGFQLFYPDQYGIVDFTDTDQRQLKKLSKRVNLDFVEGITITPGQFLLGHSMEYVKLPNYIAGNLEGRSSFARLGIEIHMTAGFIDPGFEGVITFEIYNAGANTVKLYPGMRIGQLRLQFNREPEKPYGEKHTVKYKGLLEHNVSRQNKDYEVALLRTAHNKRKIK